ncbi:transposase, partial [Pseudofrankia sp. BMG5.37]
MVRRGRRPLVRIGPVDPTVTGAAGLVAVTALVDRLDLVGGLDDGIGRIKRRDRGLTAGQLLVGMAASQLGGESSLAGLDRSRADRAGTLLAPVSFPPSRTAARLAERFGPAQLAGIERGLAGIAERMMRFLPAQRRAELVTGRPTLDCDASDVEVYGRKKRGVAYTHDGKRAGRPLLISWARTGLTLAADLLAGNQDPRPFIIALMHRALSVLPDAVCAPAVFRCDSGFFSAAFMRAVVAAGGDFAISAPRNQALWRAYAQVPEDRWVDARGMRGAQVAACDYAPDGAPPGTYTIVRRVKVTTDDVSADPRSRRGRTIVPGQRQLLLDGMIDHSWAVSFLVTSLSADEPDGIVAVEHWFRGRADIETRIKEHKLGAGLRHLPSADPTINQVWMWAAVLAGWISALL